MTMQVPRPGSEAPSARARVRRHPERAAYDRAIIDPILDEGWVAHVSFVIEGAPVVLPMAYVRVGDEIILHGARASRLMQHLANGAPVCVGVTLLDGLVLARSQFHHSMNFRSVVAHGTAREICDDAEKCAVLAALVERMARGRTTRPPTAAELAATCVLALALDESSAKTRSGPPKDRAGDETLPHWAGEVPLRLRAELPVRAPDLDRGLATPSGVWADQSAPLHERACGDAVVSTDTSRLDIDLVYDFLSRDSYWARGIPRATFERALAHSLCVGVYRGGAQLGFARVVTDRATFAWLCDVFVVEAERHKGYAGAMLDLLLRLPELGGLRRILLGTRDAHPLYAAHGFQPLDNPPQFMEVLRPYR